ncbi:hypothetical protein DQ04_01931100 [Trypanosoma grayi]|uniref:hypothetical protein n=1 Tax=Trypanosoma grayi TaxID=71804 RepID=UPI0004F3F1E5|nr:hypothetical protein DQ04_01931100 [Trypanosoma grayi]KEG12174.1 hypothetical protein DQ04_01931100 [Trypanosoma grayi]
MLRKRYRPLDAAEERSLSVEQLFQVGLLHDEQSYCFSWPEAPLSSILRRSNTLLSAGMHNNIVPSTPTTVVQPPIAIINSTSSDHVKDNQFCFSRSNPAISFSSTVTSSPLRNRGPPRYKRHPGAPATSSTEDNIFSLNAQQIADLKAAGAFTAFYEVYRKISTSSKDNNDEEDLELIAKRDIEEEVAKLEWRAFQESEKTAPALQRILLLTTAVPFIEGGKKNSDEDFTRSGHTWQRITYDSWIRWRSKTLLATGEAVSDANASPWGSPLLPGSFLASSAKEYFLNINGDRNGSIKTGRASEKAGGDGEDSQLLSTAVPRRRGAYGYLRWRIDLYEPKLRAAPGGGRGGYGVGTLPKLLSAAEVKSLVAEKLPTAFLDLRRDERVDPLDALALADIRSEVETWRQWLAYV